MALVTSPHVTVPIRRIKRVLKDKDKKGGFSDKSSCNEDEWSIGRL